MFALEALANGSPLIVSKVGGLRELVIGGENGFFVKPQDIEDIAKKIVYILKASDEELNKMRKKSVEIFEKRFSPQIIMEKFKTLLEII